MTEYLTARQAAERFRMSPKAVSMWASKGWLNRQGQRQHLTVACRDHRGAAMFDWVELVTAESDTRRKVTRSHRKHGYTTRITTA